MFRFTFMGMEVLFNVSGTCMLYSDGSGVNKSACCFDWNTYEVVCVYAYSVM